MARGALALLAAAAVAAMAPRSVVADPAGVQAAVSSAGLNYALQQLIPIIEAKIGSISIPDQSGEKDGFDYDLTNIGCKSFSVASAAATLSPPADVAIALGGITVACSADWKFKLKDWPHIPDGSGSVDISVSSTSADVQVTVGTDGKGHAALATDAGACSLSIGNIGLSFHGSAWDGLLNLFKDTIEGLIRSTLGSEFSSIISSFVTSDCNAELAKVPTAIPLRVRAPYNISEVMFGLCQPPAAAAGFVGVGLQGDIRPLANPAPPPLPPPVLPPISADGGAYFITAQLSSYTLLSAAYTYYAAGLMAWPVASKDIPKGLNSTSAFALIAPGLPQKYPNAPVSLLLNVSAMPALAIAPLPGGVQASVPLSLEFLVAASPAPAPPVFAFSIAIDAAVALDLAAGPDPTGAPGQFAVTGALRYINASLTAGESTVGPVSVGLLQALVDVLLPTLVLPAINAELASGIPLPSFSGLSFTAASLTLAEGYASVGLNFNYTPASGEVFGAILRGAPEA